MRRSMTVVVTMAMIGGIVFAPDATGQGVAPNPIVNPDFELFLPPEIGEALTDTPADECVGVGHQVLYGDGTWQHALIDEQDPAAAAGQVAGDPAGEAEFFAGVGHCVFSGEEGYDLAWINPVNTLSDDAIHWSDQGGTEFGDRDGDGDREAAVISGGAHHNFWQAWPSPFQAFTGNFDALEFDVEAGSIASSAAVILSFSATPLEAQSPWVGAFIDCQLRFSGSSMDASSGHVSVDPVEAVFSPSSPDCDAAKAEWDSGDDATKRQVLGRLRIIQLSFWGFERAAEDTTCECAVQIDNVSLSHATSVAEEAVLNQNVNVAPTPPDPGDL